MECDCLGYQKVKSCVLVNEYWDAAVHSNKTVKKTFIYECVMLN